MIRTFLSKVRHRILPKPDYVTFDGIVIPPKHRRYCGPEFQDNAYYVGSADKEALRVIRMAEGRDSPSILDIGSGQGRLALGLARAQVRVSYLGVDVDADSVAWCQEHITSSHPSFRFQSLNIRNSRYNPNGQPLRSSFTFHEFGGPFDIVYLYSVFSHMEADDLTVYLRAIEQATTAGSKLFFTAFIEDDVPPVSINPENYVFQKYSGPLHVVRYSRSFLLPLVEQSGFTILRYDHGTETNSQTAVIATKK